MIRLRAYQIATMADEENPSGTTAYYYDEYGEVVEEVKTMDGHAFTAQYEYDENGNIKKTIYPDGRQVSYEYNETDRVSRITSVKNGTNKVLADNVAYAPFGGVLSYTDGNGLTVKREYDMEGRLTYLKSGPFIKRQYGYDANGNITSIMDLVNPAKSQTFLYDALNRLISATGSYGSLSYEYDSVGNRTKKTANGAVTNYFYVPGTNRLEYATGAEPATYTYDANGNMIADGTNAYEYETGGTPLPIVGALTVPEPNVYPYAGGNPVSKIDPSGQNAAAIGAEIGTMIEPGVGTFIGAGIGALVTVGVIEYARTHPRCKDKKCPPCEPYPAGTVGYIGPHYDHPHYPIPAGQPHLNLWRVNQRPSDCKCFWNALTEGAPMPPLPGWVNCNNGFPPLTP